MITLSALTKDIIFLPELEIENVNTAGRQKKTYSEKSQRAS